MRDTVNTSNIFDSLVRNAFDFFDHAISGFAANPKFSLIHFCAGVEMVVKARLLKEHWTLIVSKQEEAEITEFCAGNLSSVTLKVAQDRLKKICKDEIPVNALSIFNKLASHRNKFIHFYHPDIDRSHFISEIAAEQCKTWFYLHRLLTKQWKTHFAPFATEVAKLNRQMIGHRQYLQQKFNELSGEINDLIRRGKIPQQCRSCGFKASVPDHLDSEITSLVCLVCDFCATSVSLCCPKCHSIIQVQGDGFSTCANCGYEITPEHILEQLVPPGPSHRDIANGADRNPDIHCSTCLVRNSVIDRGSYFFCTSCFDISPDAENCNWCGQMSTGQHDDPICNFCEGYMAYHISKDD